MSLIVTGTVALDNVKTPCGMKKDMLGGSAAHFSMSARLFTKVHLAAVVGKDFPNKHLQFLRRQKVDISSLIAEEGKTFRWDGEYKKEDLNTALTLETELGVIGCKPRISEEQKNIPNVFLANIDPDIQMDLLKLMKKPRLVGLDSMNLWIAHKKPSLLKLMKKVDLFVVNDGEARALSGEDNLVKAAKKLHQLGPKLVVVKKGEHGVLFHSNKLTFSFAAYPVEKVVDPTGAGDTFAGGLMGYLSKARKLDAATLKKAVLYGTTTASFNVQGFGMAKTAPLTISDVNKRMKELVEFIKP